MDIIHAQANGAWRLGGGVNGKDQRLEVLRHPNMLFQISMSTYVYSYPAT